MTFRKVFLTMAGLVSFTLPLLTNSARAQESTSNPTAQAAPVNGPSAALRDVLMAACSQSQNDFEHFLTARNKESFSRMAPAARVAFMKRFVLLNQAGKPTATTNPSGRPIVRCDTPEGAPAGAPGRCPEPPGAPGREAGGRVCAPWPVPGPRKSAGVTGGLGALGAPGAPGVP